MENLNFAHENGAFVSDVFHAEGVGDIVGQIAFAHGVAVVTLEQTIDAQAFGWSPVYSFSAQGVATFHADAINGCKYRVRSNVEPAAAGVINAEK